MKIKALFFASLREIVGERQATLDLEPGSSAGDAWQRLVSLYPRLAPHSGALAFAVNGSYAGPDHSLREGDEVAFLPPVSGG